MADERGGLVLSDIAACFEGIIPAEIATASADGVPNVTHLSRVHMLDDERVVLSNQFFSKTMRNLAENPVACVVVIDPHTYDSYRLLVQYERTERRGPIYERLRRDIDAIAALTGMEGVFRLRSADVYRVLELELMHAKVHDAPDG
jgi:predicted pyridoxine 5'-phosphate oxidase superfamily flavin-nucleotide-binding protein